MKKILTGIAAVICAFTGIALGLAETSSPAHAQGTPLIYECSATPCTNDQEFEVFDGYGNPIYSIGEYGGDAVFGDNRSVFAPGAIYNPSIVESYTTPSGYASAHDGTDASCVAPELWIAPTAIYYCTSAGTWGKWVTVP